MLLQPKSCLLLYEQAYLHEGISSCRMLQVWFGLFIQNVLLLRHHRTCCETAHDSLALVGDFLVHCEDCCLVSGSPLLATVKFPNFGKHICANEKLFFTKPGIFSWILLFSCCRRFEYYSLIIDYISLDYWLVKCLVWSLL